MTAPKTIYCYKCGTKVAELVKGTKWKKNAKGVCGDCLPVVKTKTNPDDFINNFKDMCGMGD